MNPFKGRHFQRDIILWAVRWYCKYGISYRELQEMLAERGVNVHNSTGCFPQGYTFYICFFCFKEF
ncbi:transposase for IS26 [Klebsiella pneumoniae]|nr:transposase for IS26 [Klebsiella pneumoniae]